jgi:hypothetical protein
VHRSLVVASLVLTSCSAREAERAPAVVQPEERHFVLEPAPIVAAMAAPVEKRVVLVTLDGVRWEDVVAPNAEVDILPRIYEGVAEGGVIVGASPSPGCAAVRATNGSNVSLPGYLEILTGRPPHEGTELETFVEGRQLGRVGRDPVQTRGQREVLAAAQIGIDHRRVRQQTDARAQRGALPRIVRAEGQAPRAGAGEQRQQRQQRALARAVGPFDRRHLPGAKPQIHARQRARGPVELG